jgi:hypothetical protein
MAGFYKCLVKGTAAGQAVNNILYYSTVAPDAIVWDASVATALGQAVVDAWEESALNAYPQAYAFSGVDVSMVDEDGEVSSPFTVSVVGTGAGVYSDLLATPGITAILKFNCSPAVLVNARPVPKRSYLAIGPLAEGWVADDGLYTQASRTAQYVGPAVTQGHLIGATPFVPYRVGRTEGARVAAVGLVVSSVVRPYASFRRSRLRRPSGS